MLQGFSKKLMSIAIASLLLGLPAGALTFAMGLGTGERALLIIAAAILVAISYRGAWQSLGQRSWMMAVHCTAVLLVITNAMMMVLRG